MRLPLNLSHGKLVSKYGTRMLKLTKRISTVSLLSVKESIHHSAGLLDYCNKGMHCCKPLINLPCFSYPPDQLCPVQVLRA